jgi:tRNA(Ile)-lysidine synthase
MSAEFEKKVLACCRREGILPPGAAVLAAASGGPDSTALLYCLNALSAREGWRLGVAHLDHGLRPESADDAAFVRRQATSLGLPFLSVRLDVRSLPTSAGRSLEDAARVARRSFLGRAAKAFGADAVALGHNLDDQAETVLLNLARGTGTLGLAGMPPAAGIFARPLLGCSRAEILAYLDGLGVPWCEDPTNRDTSFARNWFRHEVLPTLEARMPGAAASFAALAAAARADEAALERRTAALLSRLVVAASGREITLEGAFPAALPAELRGRAVRRVFRELVGSSRGLSRRHVEDALSLREGDAVCLPSGVVARRGRDGVRFQRAEIAPALTTWEAALAVPGRTRVPPAGVGIAAELARAPERLRGLGLEDVWLDERFAEARLLVRSRREGDCINAVGLGGRKKLQDIFVDAKVPREERSRWPVVCEGCNVVWVPALALAEGAAAAPGTPAVHLAWVRGRAPADATAAERTYYGLPGEYR